MGPNGGSFTDSISCSTPSEINKQVSTLLPTLQRKLARTELSILNEPSRRCVDASKQELDKRTHIIAEPRESDPPSRLAEHYFGADYEPSPFSDTEDDSTEARASEAEHLTKEAPKQC